MDNLSNTISQFYLTGVNWKKVHNLKAGNYVLRLSEDLITGDSLSYICDGLL